MSLDPDKCYLAILARDGRFDGVFFTAVVSTGVYCRPVCPAKTPLKQNCRFFHTAAAAEAAGFRPCLRCRPELSPVPDGIPDSTVRRAFALMQSGEFSYDKIGEIAAELGLSDRQLRGLAEGGTSGRKKQPAGNAAGNTYSDTDERPRQGAPPVRPGRKSAGYCRTAVVRSASGAAHHPDSRLAGAGGVGRF